MMDASVIVSERDGAWLTLWLNRPESRNALSSDMVEALATRLADAAADPAIRGITIRGKGGTFCAGGDLKAFRTITDGGQSHEQVAEMSKGAGRLFRMIETQPQVVVVLVEGAAMAGGLGLACAADIVAVTRDAQFALTETMIGIPPAQIAPYVARRVGMTQARRIMLTGARFKGDEAGKVGIANAVVEDAEELSVFETDIRKAVLRCAPGANAVTKKILLAVGSLDAESMLDFAGDRFAHCLLSEEGREGVASFLEKRKPAWAG
ncbi:enoyl-CoA hydratase/isomerase family protein [Cribrihabitans sp. XS_ASV171]